MFKFLSHWFRSARGINTGLMVAQKPNAQTGRMEEIHYSTYSEYEYRVEDKKILVRFVTTFGKERLPANLEGKSALLYGSDKQLLRDGLTQWVSEVYFINYTDSPVTIKPVQLTISSETLKFESVLTIEAHSHAITPPLVQVQSNYGTEIEVDFSFIIDEKLHEVKGVAQRLTLDEVRAKYS